MAHATKARWRSLLIARSAADHRALQPASNDFAMLRLVLLAPLKQIGGIMLTVGRSAK